MSHFTDSVSSIPNEYRNQVRDITDEMAQMDGFRVIGGTEGGGPNTSGASEQTEPVFDLSGFDFEGVEGASNLVQSLGFGILLLFLLAIPVLWVMSALVFKLACRMAGEDPPGIGRACGILLAQGLCGSAVGAAVGGLGALMGVDGSGSLAGSVAVGGASMILPWMANAGILVSMMGYGFGKCLWVGVLHTLLVVVMVGGPIGVIAVIAMVAG